MYPLGRFAGLKHRQLARQVGATSLTTHVRVPRHVMRLITQLVVDNFAYVARPGASARRAAYRAARRRLLRL
jgi:hypothetical protein